MNKRPCFVTVCGGGEDYDFLLGAIQHHADLGDHLVLDTTPPERVQYFKDLPRSVRWIHEPIYGSGWDTFRFVSALSRAIDLAEYIFAPDVIVQLDSDDFFSEDSWVLFPLASKEVIELQYVHWLKDGNPYVFGESEWHRRMWPAHRGIHVVQDPGWSMSRNFDGNPDTHPMLRVPDGVDVTRVGGLYRHHLHFALGKKADDHRVAVSSITGWPHAKRKAHKTPWPFPLASWRDTGTPPSRRYL